LGIPKLRTKQQKMEEPLNCMFYNRSDSGGSRGWMQGNENFEASQGFLNIDVAG